MSLPLRSCALLAIALSAPAVEVWVSPRGDDRNPGTQAKPLATLEAARDRLRSEGAKGSTVHLTPGVWLRQTGLVLEEQDGGSTWVGDSSLLIGGLHVPAGRLAPVTDEALLARLDPTARSEVRQLDLAALGIRHTGPLADRFIGGGGILQITSGGVRLPLARWPDTGWTTIETVLDSGISPQPHGGVFVSREDRPTRWLNALDDGVWLAGFWRVPWELTTVRVAAIDADTRTVTLAEGIPKGIGSKYTPEVNGTRAGDGKEAWCALNVLEELDRPGEWVLRGTTLIIWPTAATQDEGLLLADVAEPLIHLDRTSGVTVRGIAIEGGLGTGLRITGGAGNRLLGNTVSLTGDLGIDVHGGTGHEVRGNEVRATGADGIRVDGGDFATLTPAKHLIANNHVHDVGQVKAIIAGIDVHGVGSVVRNNLIHDSPYGGIRYEGNDHLLELNEVHSIGLEGGDLGAFYSTGGWAGQGNEIRYNLVHRIPGQGFYADDGASGHWFHHNISVRCESGVFIGGGHDNRIEDNLAVACTRSVHIDDRGRHRAYDASSKRLMDPLLKYHYLSAPWSERYPALTRILDQPTLPTGNLVARNVAVACGEIRLSMEEDAKALITLEGNRAIAGDPGFVNVKALDLRLAPGVEAPEAALHIAGSHAIGLVVDEVRTTLPDDEATGRFRPRQTRVHFDSNVDLNASNQKP